MAMSLFALCLVLLPPFPDVSLSGGQSVVKTQVLADGRGKGKFTSGLKGGVQKAERFVCVCVGVCVCVCVCPCLSTKVCRRRVIRVCCLVSPLSVCGGERK